MKRLLLIFFTCPIIILAIVLMLYALLPDSITNRDMIAAICGGFLGFVYIAVLATMAVKLFLFGAKRFDPIFANLGLSARPHLAFGREYTGIFHGRSVRAIYLQAHHQNPATLYFYLSAATNSRAAILRDGVPLLDCTSCQRFIINDPPQSLQVFADDARRVEQFLHLPQTRDLLARLVCDGDAFGKSELYIQPQTLWMRMTLDHRIDQRLAAQRLADLSQLANEAERFGGL